MIFLCGCRVCVVYGSPKLDAANTIVGLGWLRAHHAGAKHYVAFI